MQQLALIITATLATASLQAQTPPCESLNDQTNNAASVITLLNSQYLITSAWKITAQSSVTVQSMRIWCGHNYVGSLPSQRDPVWKLEIFTDGGAQPGQLLGGGKWQIIDGRPAFWQGTNLDTPVTLISGTVYWVLWTEPGWSNPPIQTSGTFVPTYRLVNGAWSSMNTEAVKVRFFCNLLDEQGVVPAGAPCTGSNNNVGSLFTNEFPQVGNGRFSLEGAGFQPSVFGFMFFGVIPGYPSYPLPVLPPGCQVHTDVFATTSGVTGTGGMAGHVLFPIPLPNVPSFAGVYFSGQLGVLDLGLSAPLPMATSNALQITIL